MLSPWQLSVGRAEGDTDDVTVGHWVGTVLGLFTGAFVGIFVGEVVGLADGLMDRVSRGVSGVKTWRNGGYLWRRSTKYLARCDLLPRVEGKAEGVRLGSREDCLEGSSLGIEEGLELGKTDGMRLGSNEGIVRPSSRPLLLLFAPLVAGHTQVIGARGISSEVSFEYNENVSGSSRDRVVL